MQVFNWIDLGRNERNQTLARPSALTDPAMVQSVRDILLSVKTDGDAALIKYASQFDKVDLSSLIIQKAELKSAWQDLPQEQKQALEQAKANIDAFHIAQKPEPISVETMPGVICRREVRAIDTVGLYVPGGTAPLVSTLLMLAIPAKIAGCDRRIIITPPDTNGQVNSAILAAAFLCDVSDVFVSGGAQAIAALAYGTQTVPRCDKIFGPGNSWVATAKSLVSQEPGGPAIDLPAGPSEAMVIADKNASPVFVAADLLSQAEHDVMAQVVCVCDDQDTADKVITELNRQLPTLPRKNIAEKSMASSRFLIAGSRKDTLSIINQYAPEHLIIQTDNPDDLVPDIRNAGSIFLGPWTPESVGDYASGTNHTLPTFGAARAHSGVTLESFYTYMSIQTLSQEGLRNLGPTVETLAEMEGLEAHKRAVSLRLAPDPEPQNPETQKND